MAQRLKRLPAMQETWVPSLGQEDPLQKGMAIHSRILAWRIPWTKEPSRLQPMRSQRVGHTEQLTLSLFFTSQLKKFFINDIEYFISTCLSLIVSIALLKFPICP